MATIVNNPSGTTERVVEREVGDSSAGWAIAIIVLLAVIAIGAYLFTHNAAAPGDTQQPGANINVTLPSTGNQPSNTNGNTTGGNTSPGGTSGAAPATQY